MVGALSTNRRAHTQMQMQQRARILEKTRRAQKHAGAARRSVFLFGIKFTSVLVFLSWRLGCCCFALNMPPIDGGLCWWCRSAYLIRWGHRTASAEFVYPFAVGVMNNPIGIQRNAFDLCKRTAPIRNLLIIQSLTIHDCRSQMRAIL